MARLRLGSVWIATLTLLFAACGQHHTDDRPRLLPVPRDGTTPPRERHESGEPPKTDPAAKPPPGYRRMAIGGMAPQNVGTAIVLTDDSEGRGLLLRLGPKDAVPVALPFGHVLSKGYDRPLNRELLYAAIRNLGGDLRSVRIDRLEDDVFYASVFLAKGGHSFELDARPSDALSLAIGSEVPVFVAEAVLARAGIDIEKFDFRRLREEPVPIRAGEREDGVEL